MKLPSFLIKRQGPLINTFNYQDTKDPCPVFDGKNWHIFGSGGTVKTETWEILHAIAPTMYGPWELLPPAKLKMEGPMDHVAAPGVIYDHKEKAFHMFVQTDFLALDGTVQHLISKDGDRFNNFGTVLRATPNSPQACIYDPHPAIIDGKYYLTYSGGPQVGHPDIYLAESKSNSWYGPWESLGKILSQEEVPHHNQNGSPNYEWGLEGSQIIQLPTGQVLMNAVCFLPDGPFYTRQRVFFAIADSVTGPYKTLGPVLEPSNEGWESGENGHAAAIIHEDKLSLFYQARPDNEEYNNWRYGIAEFDYKQLSLI